VTSLKVMGSIPEEVIEFLFFSPSNLILLQHYGPGVYTVSNRNEYQNISFGSSSWLSRKADIVTSIFKSFM
jgi:hypothetical protein